jgi:hypothetical protein
MFYSYSAYEESNTVSRHTRHTIGVIYVKRGDTGSKNEGVVVKNYLGNIFSGPPWPKIAYAGGRRAR